MSLTVRHPKEVNVSIIDVDILEQFRPAAQEDEVQRDGLVRQITNTFGPNCQQQLIVGAAQVGKTCLLAQFARYHSSKVISYFITPSPLSQRQHSFLYSLCYQLAFLLKKSPPSETIDLAQLQSMFTSLHTRLAVVSRKTATRYYFVIDGLEWGCAGVDGERIIDLLPIETKSQSPYLLLSCRSDMLGSVSHHTQTFQRDVAPFSIGETEAFLKGTDFSSYDIHRIHEKCGGHPGYLRAIKQTKLAHPHIDVVSSSDDLTRLMSQQIDLTLSSCSDPSDLDHKLTQVQ